MALVHRETKKTHRDADVGARQPVAGLPLVSIILGTLTLIGMMVSIWAIFLYAPRDALQGEPQRIFYFHLPTAILGMLAFGVVALGGIVSLWKKDERWDWLARAAAELGTVFITFALLTGSIWGKATWGTWWVWDERLTTTLILWFIYVGYLMLRSYMGRTTASARAGAVLAIIGVVDVPIIYMSVKWARTLHPGPVLSVGSSPQLPPEMLITLLISFVTFTLLFIFLMIQLYQVEKMQTLAQRLRMSLE